MRNRTTLSNNKVAKMEAYMRIMHKTSDGYSEISAISQQKKKILFHAYVRFLCLTGSETDPKSFMMLYFYATELCKFLTPRDVMEVFPITKKYDGKRDEIKDYFFTKDMIERLGIDTPLGDNVNHFLFDYQNWQIEDFVIESMSAMNAIRRSQGKKDMLVIFYELMGFKTGVDTEIVKDKLSSGIDGLEWLVLQTTVDDERKQRLEEAFLEFDGVDGFIERAKKSLHNPDKSVTDWIVLRDLFTHLALLRQRKYDDYFELLGRLKDKPKEESNYV